MGRFNEFIARAANKEDGVKGRFWESRFKCQVLLDEAAIAACMVYVDLNPLRAGQARTPENSNFTSIQERIRAWRKEMRTTASVETKAIRRILADSHSREKLKPEDTSELSKRVSEGVPATGNSSSWLCPITSERHRHGILPMTATEYFDLVDKTGRAIRFDKRGVIETDLAPILLRIGANPEVWSETVRRFGNKFHLVAGLITNIRKFADQLGRQWFTGVAAARTAFAPSPPQFA